MQVKKQHNGFLIFSENIYTSIIQHHIKQQKVLLAVSAMSVILLRKVGESESTKIWIRLIFPKLTATCADPFFASENSNTAQGLTL